MAVGDFNMVLDERVDKCPSGTQTGKGVIMFSQIVGELGLGDIWGMRNPTKQEYSCFSKTHSMLSRIDLALGSEDMLHFVRNINYMPKGRSDHSTLVVSLSQGEEYCKGDWKISPYWLEIIGGKEGVILSLLEFMSINAGTAPLGVVWDALKAFFKGKLIQHVACY